MYEYDAADRLTTLTHYGPDGTPEDLGNNPVLATFEYDYDAFGRRVRTDEQIGGVDQSFDWRYDDLGRLTREVFDQTLADDHDYTADYVFGLTGNRLKKTVDYATLPDKSYEYRYDSNDRLFAELVDEGDNATIDQYIAYEYGDGANHVQQDYGDGTQQTRKVVYDGADWTAGVDSSTTFAYDARGRLVDYQEYDAQGVAGYREQHVYNADGNRVRATRGATQRRFVIDDANPTGYAQVLEEREGAALKRSYAIGLDVLAQASPSAAVQHFLYDAHGSTRALLNEDAVAEQYDYTANGLPIGFTLASAQTNLLYSGEYTELATGQQNLRARVYDPLLGRFVSMDPFDGVRGTPVTLHKYLYGNANPVTFTDPSGRFSASLGGTLAGAGIRAGIAGASVGALFRVPIAVANVLGGNELATESWNLSVGLASDFAIGAVLGGGGTAALRLAPNLVKLRALGQSIVGFRAARLPSSVWRHTGSVAANRLRGLLIKKSILSRPAAFLGRQIQNFPIVADYIIRGGRGIATSIKSLDLTAATYQSPAALLSRLNQLAKPLQTLTFRTHGGFTIGSASTPITDKVLVVAFEQGAATSTQAQVISRFLREAGSRFPDVKVVVQFIL